MRADHSHDEDPVQVCASLYPFCMYAYSTPYNRTSHCTRAPPGAPHHLYLHVARRKHPSSFLHPPSPPLPLSATETGIQTQSTSFPSPHLLIPHRHPFGAVRARARYRRCSSHHISLYRPSRLARASQTTPVKQRPRPRNRRSSGKGKACARDNFRLEWADACPAECVREQLVRAWQQKHESEGVKEDEEEDEEAGEEDRGSRRR